LFTAHSINDSFRHLSHSQFVFQWKISSAEKKNI
jgi:hypothetical protein